MHRRCVAAGQHHKPACKWQQSTAARQHKPAGTRPTAAHAALAARRITPALHSTSPPRTGRQHHVRSARVDRNAVHLAARLVQLQAGCWRLRARVQQVHLAVAVTCGVHACVSVACSNRCAARVRPAAATWLLSQCSMPRWRARARTRKCHLQSSRAPSNTRHRTCRQVLKHTMMPAGMHATHAAPRVKAMHSILSAHLPALGAAPRWRLRRTASASCSLGTSPLGSGPAACHSCLRWCGSRHRADRMPVATVERAILMRHAEAAHSADTFSRHSQQTQSANAFKQPAAARAPVSASQILQVPSEEADATPWPPGSQGAQRSVLTSAAWMVE